MADDPNKKHIDARFVSSQPWEIEYVVDRLQSQFPNLTRQTIRDVVLDSKREIEPSEDRQKLMDRAASKLR